MPEAGTLTLLFTDLVGSTEILSRLGEEGAEKLRQAHFSLLRDAGQAHGGEEVKNLGDGLMVVFGSSLAAVNCAVAMQQAIARHNRRATTALSVRIGVSVGEPTREEGDYFGTPVVEASRLCAAASGGEVLVAELVRLLVGGRGGYSFRSVGALELKGLPEPLAAWSVEWRAPEGADRAGAPLPAVLDTAGRTAFVGREAALAQLRAAWERTCEGKREAVFLAGEPGIGKTRAAAEFVRELHREGATVLFGRSNEETLLPFQPFVEALGQYTVELDGHELREQVTLAGPEVSMLVPDLARRLPGLAEPVHGDPEGERYRLFEAVTTLFAVASSAAPLVLVLDDLHWADKPSLLLLKHILRSLNQARILVLGTYRETDLSRSHPLADVMADLRREHLFERISLSGLDAANVATMIANLAGDGPPPEVTRAIHAETDGNPFFVEEVLRHLQESGGLVMRDGRWVGGRRIEEMGIPEGVREVLGRRLNRLSEGCNRVLAVAAVIGREFDLKVLARVADMDGDALFELIEEGLQARALEEVRGSIDHYTFAHALIRQVLYEELSAGRRVRLHRQVGLALEAGAQAGAQVNDAELARHFLQAAPAGETARAVLYAARTAALHTRQAAHEEAAEFYASALQALEAEPDPDRECELLTELGQSQRRAGEARRAAATFLKAAELARGRAEPERLAPIALLHEEAFLQAGVVRPDPDPSVDLLNEALAQLGDGHPALRSRLLASLARAVYFGGEIPHGGELSDEAVALARAAGDADAEVEALDARRTAIWGPDCPRVGRLAAACESLAAAEARGNLEVALEARKWVVTAALEGGDMAAVDAEIERYARDAALLKQPSFSYYTHVLRTMRLTMTGDFDAAAGEIAATKAIADRTGNGNARDHNQTQAFWLAALTGDFSATAPYDNEYRARYVVLAAWGDMHRLGAEAVRSTWDPAVLIPELVSSPRDFLWTWGITTGARLAGLLGDAESSRRIYELLLPFAAEMAVTGPAITFDGARTHHLGMLAAAFGELDDAVRHMEDAVAANDRIGARPLAALSRQALAAILARRAQPGDNSRATELARAALGEATALRMAPLERQALDLLRTIDP